jgi:outer membrane protein
MKTYHKLLLLFLLLPSFAVAQPDGKWSLEDCIRYAWKNNLRIKNQELSVEQGQNNLDQAKYNFAPRVSASLNHSMNWGRSVNVQDLQIIENKLSQSTSASASASINLIEGNIKNNELKSKQIELEIARAEVQRTRNDIALEIARAYLQVLLSGEILKTATESLSSIEEQVARTEKLVDAGSLAYSSLLEIEAQLAAEKVQVVNARNQLSNAILSLSQLLDLEDDSSFEIEKVDVEFLVTEYKQEPAGKIMEFSSALPQIKAAELNIENSRLQYKIAKGRLYPVLSFNAGYGTYYSDSRDEDFFGQFNENRNPSMGFGISIPIFNNYQLRTGVKNSGIAVRSSEIEYQSRLQTLFKEIRQAQNEAGASYEQYKASTVNAKAMEESFRYVQQKFDVGVLNATDYTVARSNLFKARSDLLQAKYQYVFQLKILDFYKGVPITL